MKLIHKGFVLIVGTMLLASCGKQDGYIKFHYPNPAFDAFIEADIPIGTQTVKIAIPRQDQSGVQIIESEINCELHRARELSSGTVDYSGFNYKPYPPTPPTFESYSFAADPLGGLVSPYVCSSKLRRWSFINLHVPLPDSQLAVVRDQRPE